MYGYRDGLSAIRRAARLLVVVALAGANAACGGVETVGGVSQSATKYQFRWGPLAIDRQRDTVLWKCPEGTENPSPEKCAPVSGTITKGAE